MNRRGKRLTLGVVVGVVVLLGLAVLHWSTVRDHVEAWIFQLTRKTETIEPDATHRRPTSLTIDKAYLQMLASQLDCPVVFDQQEMSMAVLSFPPGVSGIAVLTSHVVSGDISRELLLRSGYRVLEQRFPQRAYVVIRDNQ